MMALGFVHLSSTEFIKVIAIFYAKLSAERFLNINKTTTKQNKIQDA